MFIVKDCIISYYIIMVQSFVIFGGILVKYIFEKSVLTELVSGGCKKNVINRLNKSWRKLCETTNSDDKDYIIRKLGLSGITVADKPPLVSYQKEGKLAEISIIEELSFRNRIGTNLDIEKKAKESAYRDFINSSKVGTDFVFDKSNRDKIKLNKSFDNEDFFIDFSEKAKVDVDKLRGIFDPSKYEYIYQFKFFVENDFYFPLIKNKNTLIELKKHDIAFRKLIPDFIKIIHPASTQYKVFDENFNIEKPSPSKIKLQVCDIKMAEFSNKFFLELGLYMLTLNSFIFNNKLSEYFEVVTEGLILPKSNNESEKERNDRINDPNYKLEQWQCSFSTVKDKLAEIFNKGVLDIINIIENGSTEEYNKIKITPKCQTCDNYGGQYSDNLKKYIKKYNKNNSTNYTIEEFYNNVDNNYCRYMVINTKDINTLPCLKNGEKNVLKNNKINNLGELEVEIMKPNSKIFNDNIALKSDHEILKHNVNLRSSGGDLEYIKDSNTMNMPKNSNLNIYMDERHDSQGRSLSFSFIYQFKGKDPKGNDVSENNFKNPYISIIDEKEFTASKEKTEFLDFLIEINKLLNKYESYANGYNQVPTFSIIYWGEKGIEHVKNLFLDVFEHLKTRGNNIDVLYNWLTQTELKEKKKEIGKLIDRFNSFFTSDNELEDYRIVEKSPFYNLKAAVEDIVALNINISNNLYSVNNKIMSEDKKPIYHKPDSDDFNGWIFSNVWKHWVNSVERRNFINSLEKVLADRLFCIYKIAINLDKAYFKGQSPNIPKLQKVQLFSNLKFGIDIYLLHKLNAAYSLIEKENIHTLQVHKKSVLGKSILLEEEIVLNRDNLLKKHFGTSFYRAEEYKVYKVHENSIDANYDERSFALTIYPVNKSHYIYMKFNSKSSKNCISFDEKNDLIGVNLFNYNKESSKYTMKNYRQAIQVKIQEFNRTSKYVILKLERDTATILNFLEDKHGFDFSKDIVLESTHVDIWESRLKDCLARVEKDETSKNILEEYDPTPINSYTGSEVKKIISKYLNGKDVPLDDSQLNSIAAVLNKKLTLLWGPPGTGKSHTIAHLLLFYYLILNANEQKRVLIMGNYDATDNIIKSCSKVLDEQDISIVRVRSKGREFGNFSSFQKLNYIDFEINTENPDFKTLKDQILKLNNALQIFTCTPEQMTKAFISRVRKFKFDLVIVDEASQMDVGHFIAGLIKVAENTQILLAGDNLQLPPITNVKLKEPDKNIYGSVFDYYNHEFGTINPSMRSELLYNRRSNSVIVEFNKTAFNYPSGYKADKNNKDGKIQFSKPMDKTNFYDKVLDPECPIVMLNYDDGNSSQVNTFEAEQVVEIVKNIISKELCEFDKHKTPYNIFDLFDKGIGIVVPHRAQRTKIQNMLIDYLNSTTCFTSLSISENEKLMEKIRASVDTVEKYQGQQREIIICSYVLGDEDIIAQEEQFIYNPNRLNVMISRARFKAIILASNELVSNVSDNIDVIELQKSLQELVTYCDEEEIIIESNWKSRNGILKYKGF